MPTSVEGETPFHDSSDHLDEHFCNNLKIQEELDKGGMEDLQEQQAQQIQEEEEEEEEEEEFSFMCEGANSSPIAAEDAFINGQIKPVFPFFSGQDLPMRPPVKVFVETTTQSSAAATSSSGEWSNRKAIEASPEVCKKSNSTGFSKIWRFKDFLGRSNSDGRDAFIFLDNNGHHQSAEEKKGAKKENSNGKVNVVKARAGSKKGKTAALSAHEVYLKSKAKEEDRRRSYLPYRPELMGFFTNVNGGLSKNVHPF